MGQKKCLTWNFIVFYCARGCRIRLDLLKIRILSGFIRSISFLNVPPELIITYRTPEDLMYICELFINTSN